MKSVFRRPRVTALGYLLILPAFLVILFVMIIPLAAGSTFSLFDFKFGTGAGFGRLLFLKNFFRFFQDAAALKALQVTLLFSAGALAGELFLGILIAVLLDKISARAAGILRAIFCMPLLVSPIIVGLIWRYMYDPTFGLVYSFFSRIGLRTFFGGLNSPAWALLCVIIADIWETTPFVLLVITSGLAVIPEELYEAARIDGAGSARIFFSIMLPLLVKVISVVLVIRGGDAFRVFDIIYALTGGGPANSTLSLSILTFKEGFIKYQMGYAMAISLITMLIIVGLFSSFSRVSVRQERRG